MYTYPAQLIYRYKVKTTLVHFLPAHVNIHYVILSLQNPIIFFLPSFYDSV